LLFSHEISKKKIHDDNQWKFYTQIHGNKCKEKEEEGKTYKENGTKEDMRKQRKNTQGKNREREK